MRIVAVSDTHGRHYKVKLPLGDLLIHAGDFTNMGEMSGVENFCEWLDEQPHPHKVVIAGNHELQWNQEKQELLSRHCIYLQDSGIEIGGLKIWGSPFTPRFGAWNFMLSRGTTILEKWLKIPEGTDIVITHGPPKGILDQSYQDSVSNPLADPFRAEHVGCFDLALVMEAIAPKLHIFGHIHGGYGTMQHKGTMYVNASIVDERYQPVNAPHVIESMDL